MSAEPESRWACPVCGEHRLALEAPPQFGAMGYQPYNEIIGMGDPVNRPSPEIVCQVCSRRWPNAGAFWAETGETPAR